MLDANPGNSCDDQGLSILVESFGNICEEYSVSCFLQKLLAHI